ncbi:MAG TPA: LysR family transcriptional regulator [Clostridia bacterium]|jgi:DNA-binding transcriptional LysR family regulator|nr:LysR family transcriptional regulator [Clostridia bacterium]
MNVDFELYKVFYYVAKNLSFSEAANFLFISQSAVSQAIKLLEEKLQTKLFFRNTKQVKLTREGETLFQYVEQAFNLIKSGERSLKELNYLTKGEVKIGASDTICKHHLLPYFKKFNQLYPQIKIQITNRTSLNCIELLKKGNIDMAVINLPQKENYKHLTVEKLKTVQDVFVAGKNYQHLKNRTVSLKELITYPILVLEKNSVTREFFDNLLEKNGLKITPEIELGSVDLLIDLTKIGLGISFVIKEYVEKELANQELFIINLKEKIPPRYLGIVTNNHLPLPLAAQKFVELMHDKSSNF